MLLNYLIYETGVVLPRGCGLLLISPGCFVVDLLTQGSSRHPWEQKSRNAAVLVALRPGRSRDHRQRSHPRAPVT